MCNQAVGLGGGGRGQGARARVVLTDFMEDMMQYRTGVQYRTVWLDSILSLLHLQIHLGHQTRQQTTQHNPGHDEQTTAAAVLYHHEHFLAQ
jgi:hypothetical protein